MTCRLFARLLAQQPPSEEFVYLKRIDKGPAEYNPYAMQVGRGGGAQDRSRATITALASAQCHGAAREQGGGLPARAA